MMITLETLDRWLIVPAETENLEFKEAKQQFNKVDLLRYCVALANEGGGYLVLGVTNKPPRRVVGSQAFPSQNSLNEINDGLVQLTHRQTYCMFRQRWLFNLQFAMGCREL